MRKLLILSFGIVLAISSCTNEKREVEVPQENVCDSMDVSYANDIAPMINLNCGSPSCHGSGGSQGDMSTYNLLKNYVDQGEISDRVLILKDMPPSGPLNDIDLEKLNCWIENGAANN